MVEISDEDFRYYQAESGSMGRLMQLFRFELHNFGTENQYYDARHPRNGKVVGHGKIPAEAVGDWIEQQADPSCPADSDAYSIAHDAFCNPKMRVGETTERIEEFGRKKTKEERERIVRILYKFSKVGGIALGDLVELEQHIYEGGEGEGIGQ